MLAAKSVLRNEFGDSGPTILHMRVMDDENRKQRYTMFPNIVYHRDIAGQPRTEIVICLQ
jgi:hypothetical protein